MKEIYGNIWDSDVDIICVTTNGSIYKGQFSHYYNPMGGGIANEAKNRIPNLERTYGLSIMEYGHTVRFLGKVRKPHKKSQQIFAFPTMYKVGEQANIKLIEFSLFSLFDFSDIYPELVIGLPRPGCGIGGLSWERQVKPLLIKLIINRYEDRIIIYHYTQEKIK